MSLSAGDASLADGFARAPISLGWITSHALESRAPSPTGFDAVAIARAVAEGMRTLPKGAPDAEKPWTAFAAPFLAASEHLQAIRNPVPTMAAGALAGIGAAAAEAGLPGARRPDVQRTGSQSAKPAQALAGIGAVAADAAAKAGTVFQVKNGSWVETGNPSLGGIGAAAAGILAGLESGLGTSGTAPKAAGNREPARSSSSRSKQPAPPSAAMAEGTFAKLLKRMESIMRVAVSSAGRDTTVSEGGTPGAESPRRAPFIDPQAPETQDRFRNILASGPTAQVPATGADSNSSDTVSPVSPSSVGPEPEPATASLAGILAGLAGTEPAGQTDLDRTPTGPGPQPDPFSPVEAPFSGSGPVVQPSDASRPPRPYPAAAPAAGTAPAKPAEMEWLDSEDDLAARLHSLLRRQARRRGVDLA